MRLRPQIERLVIAFFVVAGLSGSPPTGALGGPAGVHAGPAGMHEGSGNTSQDNGDRLEVQPSARTGIDAGFREALQNLASECRDRGEGEAATLVENWFVPRDPQRLYIFLPATVDRNQPAADQADWPQWYTAFREIRHSQADALFQLARDSMDTDDAGQACMLLHEVLHENPDHAEARRILGFTWREEGWSRGKSVNSTSIIRRRHGAFDWAPGKHWKVATDHFVISTSHSAEEGERLGQSLEKLFSVWQQVFFEFWSDSGTLARRFEADQVSPNSSMGRSRKFKVILFKDRDEYIGELADDVPGIEQTYGYYNPSREESFFFSEGDAHERTWFHETTHQLFQESIRAASEVGADNNVWSLEGIATFMESWQDHGDYITLGGFDASWLQFARFRKQNQGFYIPMDELVKLNKTRLQSSESIQAIYSQSAGLSHFLMVGANQRYRRAYIAFLETLYRPGRHRPDALFTLTGRTPEQLDGEYEPFLTVQREQVASHILVPAELRQLVLGFSNVDDASLEVLEQAVMLQLLDLTATRVTDKTLSHLGNCDNLAQLFLGGTGTTDEGLKMLADIRSLQELDLVGTRVTNDGIQALAGLDALQSLRLTGTRVDDGVIETLVGMRSLRSVDLSETAVTDAAVERLRRARSDMAVAN